MESAILNDIIIIFGISIFVLYICNKLHISIIVGFLITGILVGPYGLGLISNPDDINVLAEIGIILLLFTIGVELSLKELWDMKRSVILGGGLQVLFTTLGTLFAATQFGFDFSESLFLGFLISLSSTAIVLKTLQKRAELHSLHGRTILSILLFQDVIVVAMIVATPFLAGVGGNDANSILMILLKSLAIIIFIMFFARWLIPHILYHIAKTRNPELFLLSVIVICLSVAMLTYSAGLSLALGAFLAGLVISESEYSHQALNNILPFKDVFLSIFFVSIGMLLNVQFFLDNPLLILLVTIGVMLFKGVVSGFVSMVLGYPLRNSILTGMALAQVGEFSFVLSKFGVEYGLLDNYLYQMFLDISILTMAVTSFSISYSPSVAANVLKLPIPHKLKCGFARKDVTKMYDKKEKMSSHLIIVGFGFNGKTVAKAANAAGIPYLVIETNPESVREGLSKGENIFYGDATQESVLEKADIDSAKIMIVGISDATATRRVIWLARQMNPNIHIIARTRYLQEMGPLYEQGADEVIPEEFETSVEIFVRLLRRYLVPEDQIHKFIEDARADGYDMFRSISSDPLNFEQMQFDIPDVNIVSLRVPLGADVVGMTLEDLSLRQRFGITVLAIRRGLETITNPGGDVRILEGDILVLLGSHEDMKEIGEFFTDLSKKNTKRTEE